MQIHYGCKRDNNAFMYKQLGPDTGYDCINNYAPSAQTADFLNLLIATNELPKTILYSLNPNDNEAIGTILGCKPEDKEKVLAVMKENEYTPNAFARGLGLGSMKTVGIICPNIADIYMAKAVSYLESSLHGHGI